MGDFSSAAVSMGLSKPIGEFPSRIIAGEE
jgi:hypothetical protein